ncbi:MAG: S41 family peptidase [Chthonomonas sp.]|nr:S41 family peptidase [Chthonomonas sp.]
MKRWISLLAGLILAPATFFMVGFSAPELRDQRLPDGETLARVLPKEKKEVAPVETFLQVHDFIHQNYYKKVDDADLTYAGMSGVMASLGDPHTMFFEPEVSEAFAEETRGAQNYGGVGARLMRHDLGVKITSAFPTGPAYQAGIRDRDIITHVNGKSIAGQETDAIIKQIKGPEGTNVKLRVLRGNGSTPEFTIRRAQVLQPSVDGTMIEGSNVVYISVFGFSQVTARQFEEQLNRFGVENAEGLIIDLRGNPGGLLEAARDMLSMFAENKIVVSMRDRTGNQQVTKTYHNFKRDIRCPVVILINEDSASASEIFAGAMKDYGLATLVGAHSYGKASVQNLIPFNDGASAKITVAKYFLPNGADISRKQDDDGQWLSGGLKPDVEVKMSFHPDTQVGDPNTDAQLKKALEVIKEKRAF